MGLKGTFLNNVNTPDVVKHQKLYSGLSELIESTRVLEIAEKSYPNETKEVIKKLAELIKQGKIQNLISGGELLSLFKNLGFNISVSTSISVSKDGKITSLSDKLKNKE